MTTPTYELDIERTCTALDPDYEQWQLTWTPRRYWHTQRRCYVTRLVAEPRPAAVTPADPDALLDEAVTLFPQRQRMPIVTKIEGALRAHGPQTANDLEALTGYRSQRIWDNMAKLPDTFFLVFESSNRHWWGLVGEHEGWTPEPSELHQRIAATLRERGECDTRTLVALGYTYASLRTMHRHGLVRRRSSMRRGLVVHYWSVEGTQSWP